MLLVNLNARQNKEKVRSIEKVHLCDLPIAYLGCCKTSVLELFAKIVIWKYLLEIVIQSEHQKQLFDVFIFTNIAVRTTLSIY